PARMAAAPSLEPSLTTMSGKCALAARATWPKVSAWLNTGMTRQMFGVSVTFVASTLQEVADKTNHCQRRRAASSVLLVPECEEREEMRLRKVWRTVLQGFQEFMAGLRAGYASWRDRN